MKRFSSIILISAFILSNLFGDYVKVPKNQIKQYRFEPAPLNQADFSHVPNVIQPNTRNSGNFEYVESSTNGYGMVEPNTRPLFVDIDEGNWFMAYRQYAGGEAMDAENPVTHGQLGGAYSVDGVDWTIYTNLNSNGNPPWGGGGVGGAGSAQARYPSAIGSSDQPVAIWNEYTADVSTGSTYGGRPYYAYDSFGWDGGSFTYPVDIDLLWETPLSAKDLWSGSVSVSYDADLEMNVVNAVYNDWTRGDRWLFHSEAYEDGFIVFGTEQKVIDEVNDLVGDSDTGSYNTSSYVSFTPDGLGIVGVVGFFLGADTEVSNISNNHIPIFKLSENHGATWHGGSTTDPLKGHAASNDGDGYYFIPDAVFDDLVQTQFIDSAENGDGVYTTECDGTTYVLDSFFTYYGGDMKVDIEGNPHFTLQVAPCESIEGGYCWYMPEAGIYHFTIDRDNIEDPGPVNSETGWNWSFIMSGQATWSFPDMGGDSYLWNNHVSLAFSKDDPNIVYAVTNMAEAGPLVLDEANLEDPCYETLLSDYPEWSEDIFVVKSTDGGNTWWNPLNVSNSPDETGGVCPDGYPKCDPAEEYPHAAQWATDDNVYIMYQMPEWTFNDIGDLLGPDFMNNVYSGYATVDDSNIDEYEFDDGSDSCYAEPGDVSGDGLINVLDIVSLVNHILGSSPLTDLCAADYSGDTIVNVLDIVGLVNLILGNLANDHSQNATYAKINEFNNKLVVESDGCIQGVQLTISHDNDFNIDLVDNYIARSSTKNGVTTVLFVSNGDVCVDDMESIASISGEYQITEQIISNSKGEEVESDISNSALAADFKVKVAGPNPFNPSTSLNVSVPSAGHVSVKIYNLIGQEVATIADGFMNKNEAGYNFIWNASNLSSGVYLVRAESLGKVSFDKLMLLK